jgi:apolipoprotein N-acyltransferase
MTPTGPERVAEQASVSTNLSALAIAYPLSWRISAAMLFAISRGSLPLLLALVLFSRSLPIRPLMLMRAFAILFIAPGIAVWLIERAFAVTVRIEGGELVLQHRERRIEIPSNALARLDPWMVPLPGSGLWLRLRSGRRFRYGLQLADPTAVVEALSAAGASAGAPTALQHPSVIYAHAKHSSQRWRWYHPLFKFVGFAFLATLPLFRVHQYIAYGGTFGEYYQLGLQAYLITFGIYWGTLTIYLVLYAAVWRGMAEAVALGAAWVAPSRAARVRRAVEVALRVIYYGGVPVLVILRFLPW